MTDAEAEAVPTERAKEGALGDAGLGQVSGGFSSRFGDAVCGMLKKPSHNPERRP